MKLNRTDVNWDRVARNEINENWDILENGYNNLVNDVLARVTSGLITPSDTTFARLGKNKFSGIYSNGVVSGGMSSAKWNPGSGKSAIVRVKPNTRYVISRSGDTDRFRICGSVEFPRGGDTIDGLQFVDSQTETAVLSRNYNFLIIYLSSSSEDKEPEWFQVEERESGGATPYEPPRVVFEFEEESINVKYLRHVMNIGMLVGRPRAFDVSLNRGRITVANSGAFIYAGSRRYNPSGGVYSYDHITDFLTLLVAYNAKTDEILFLRTSDLESAQNNDVVLLGVIRNESGELSCFFNGLYLVDGKDPHGADGSATVGSDLFIHDKYFEVDETRSVPDVSAINMDYIYNIFDNLVDDFPSAVSRELFGVASDGSDIFMYEINPPKLFNSPSDISEFPKIYVQAGIHGHEWGSVLTVARFFDNLCRKWKENKGFRKMKFNVSFVVVPALNVWGINNRAAGGGGVESRKNYNGVDLNRNFPSGWVYESDKDSMYYGGEEPLPEPESKLLYNYMQETKDEIIYAVGVHNFGIYPDNRDYALWMASNNSNTREFLKGVGMSTSSELKAKYQSIDENPNSLIQITTSSQSGAENEWNEFGVLNTLLELPYEINGEDISDGKLLANKISQEALGNLILGLLNKYQFLK